MAWNEPGGEKRNPWNRPQQSQNDLDDVLRNFQRRLASLFGRGGGGGLGSGPGSSGFNRSLGSILVLIGAVWILQGVGLLKGSFMTGEAVWAVIGAVCAVIGVALLRGSRRVR